MGSATQAPNEMAALVEAFDWSRTAVGPRDGWSAALSVIVGTMLASTHPMFIWWGPELIQFYNDAYRATMGPERHPSALGQPGRECWQEIWPIIGAQIDSVMSGGPSTWHEDQLVPITRHGSLQNVWWTYGYSPIKLADGNIGGVLVVCTDVTDTHLVKQRLSAEVERRRYENERQRNMFQQAPGFTCVLAGPDHVFEFTNDAYNTLIGRRDVVGRPVVEVLPEAVDQGFIKLLDSVYASGMPFAAQDLPVNLKQGPGDELTQLILDFVYHPIIESDGTVSGVFVQGVDVTQRKGAEMALRAADRRKDEFLAMLAHELRNPLAPIIAAAQVLESGQLDADASRLASSVIHRQSRSMAVLIDDLLDASRVSRGRVSLSRQGIDLNPLLMEAIEQVRPIIDARRQALHVQLFDGALPVYGDAQRLVQVVANLLDNAAKYTPIGGRIEVESGGREADGRVWLSVSDNGNGIDADLLPRLFDLFSQGARAPDRSQGGLGIGLSICRSLVELHGGRIEVASGGTRLGARFTVTLPGFQGDLQAVSAPAAPIQRSSAPVRVLIVDDNEDAAHTLGLYLASVGHVVDVEHDGLRGLARILAEPSDVYLLDIGLPGLDGHQLARKIRATPTGAASLIVGISGYGQPADRAKAIESGFDAYFVKPADPDQLARVIEAWSGKRRPG